VTTLHFGVQGTPTDRPTWLELARAVEGEGFEVLYASDHIGVTASPFVALSAAAAVTSTLRLGPYVLNCGVREPLAIAQDVATLDVLSDGRSILGVGAGHTPVEWTMSGRAYPTASERVRRCTEVVDAVTALLRGDTVTVDGDFVSLDGAVLESPRPAQEHIPLLVGGNGRALLRFAAARADVVGLSGLSRTLADGHRHSVAWAPEAIDERVALVREAAAHAPVIDALVQHVEITDDREAVAAALAARVEGASPADVLAAPFTLIGTLEQLEEEVAGHAERWGITSYCVRAAALDAVAALIHRIRA
jgi:probable F420-dependent oxidoreductase